MHPYNPLGDKFNTPRPNAKNKRVLELVAEVSAATDKTIVLDYGNIAGDKLYSLFHSLPTGGYDLVRSGLNLAETEEYLRGMLRAMEWANERIAELREGIQELQDDMDWVMG